MLCISSTGLCLSLHSVVVVMTDGSTVSASSAVAVSANVHGKTGAGFNDSVVLSQIFDWVCAVDSLVGLAGLSQCMLRVSKT